MLDALRDTLFQQAWAEGKLRREICDIFLGFTLPEQGRAVPFEA